MRVILLLGGIATGLGIVAAGLATRRHSRRVQLMVAAVMTVGMVAALIVVNQVSSNGSSEGGMTPYLGGLLLAIGLGFIVRFKTSDYRLLGVILSLSGAVLAFSWLTGAA